MGHSSAGMGGPGTAIGPPPGSDSLPEHTGSALDATSYADYSDYGHADYYNSFYAQHAAGTTAGADAGTTSDFGGASDWSMPHQHYTDPRHGAG